jgi:hypothetical protein
MLAALLGANWPSVNLRYLYPVLPSLAVAVASTARGRWAWPALAVASVVLAALWVDVAANAYFTDAGDALGL